MVSRNLARCADHEHHNAEARLQSARETRDAVEDRRDAAHASGAGELDASTALEAAEEQLAAREAWMRWVERDY
jgi:hypothetical protein